MSCNGGATLPLGEKWFSPDHWREKMRRETPVHVKAHWIVNGMTLNEYENHGIDFDSVLDWELDDCMIVDGTDENNLTVKLVVSVDLELFDPEETRDYLDTVDSYVKILVNDRLLDIYSEKIIAIDYVG